MQLTTFTDNAFRLLIYLAAEPERSATIGEIAEYFAISHHHLVKVAHRLRQGGFIVTQRGKGGGIRLARPAAEINLGEVIRWMEPNLALVECQQAGETRCRAAPTCRLSQVFDEALAAFLATLDRYTLADALARDGRAE